MEDGLKMITRDRIPCWYELEWNAKRKAIAILIHEDFCKNARVIPEDAPIALALKDMPGSISFSGDLDSRFGLNNMFFLSAAKPGFRRYEILLPRIRIQTGKKCSFCKGTGRDDAAYRNGEKCMRCDGKKKDIEYRWKDAALVSANLALIFELLLFSEKKNSSKIPQLMTVQLGLNGDGQHSRPIWGSYSRELVRWMSDFRANTHIVEMEIAMRAAYGHMLSVHRFDRFAATLPSENGWLNADCPGDAAGIHPGGSGHIDEERGYDFSCHNMDNSAQQLCILAGLAALHMKARKEMP